MLSLNNHERKIHKVVSQYWRKNGPYRDIDTRVSKTEYRVNTIHVLYDGTFFILMGREKSSIKCIPNLIEWISYQILMFSGILNHNINIDNINNINLNMFADVPVR